MCYDIEHFSTPARNCYFDSLRNWNVNLIGVILRVLKLHITAVWNMRLLIIYDLLKFLWLYHLSKLLD